MFRCRGRTTAFDNYYVVFVSFPRFIKKGDIEQRSEKLFTDYRKSTL